MGKFRYGGNPKETKYKETVEEALEEALKDYEDSKKPVPKPIEKAEPKKRVEMAEMGRHAGVSCFGNVWYLDESCKGAIWCNRGFFGFDYNDSSNSNIYVGDTIRVKDRQELHPVTNSEEIVLIIPLEKVKEFMAKMSELKAKYGPISLIQNQLDSNLTMFIATSLDKNGNDVIGQIDLDGDVIVEAELETSWPEKKKEIEDLVNASEFYFSEELEENERENVTDDMTDRISFDLIVSIEREKRQQENVK